MMGEDRTFVASCDASEQRYIRILPSDFDAERPHDVLIALHGHGSDRRQFAEDERDECRAARDVAAQRGMIFVSPDYRAPTSWMGPQAEADLIDLIGVLHREQDVHRVFLCGGSMGGAAALTFAALHSDLVHGIAAMNAIANHLEFENFQDAISRSFGGTKTEVPEEYRKRSAELHAGRFTMPVGLTTSGKDTSTPPQSVHRLADSIRRTNPNVLLVHRDNEGHCTGYDDARAILEYAIARAGGTDLGREGTPAVVNPVFRSSLRSTLDLNGDWEFVTDHGLIGESEGWFRPDVSLPAPRMITVPGCWEAQGVGEPTLTTTANLKAAYRGAVWYRKTFRVPPDWAGRRVWLKIGGVNCQGWLWINGAFVAHNWAYCATLKYDVTDLVTAGQESLIAVRVRNDLPSRRGVSNYVRSYGGLFRGVELDATADILIDNAYAEPLLDERSVRLHLSVRKALPSPAASACTLECKVFTLPDHRLAGEITRTLTVASAITETDAEISLDPFLPWSPEAPHLYRAEILLREAGAPMDGWMERFGVKKYVVEGGDMRLNNARFFLRGCGDDSFYPLTVCSPASREEHIRHLRIVKEFGFNYVRTHTHCENPEYIEAADEVGLLIQPELPYQGAESLDAAYRHTSGAPMTIKEDLVELVTHVRRYTSVALYCGGNENLAVPPLDTELYRLAKSLDSSRPWLSLDGGTNNRRENSEVNHAGYGPDFAFTKEKDWPQVKHEYMSIGLYEDPRRENQYTGALAPNKRLRDEQALVTQAIGLDWAWADASYDSGYELQGLWHKIGLEMARLDPDLDGFSLWLMLDLPPSGNIGVVDGFWRQKKSTPEYFRQFNAPTVILAQAVNTPEPTVIGLTPATQIHTAGSTFEVDWVVSHFQPDGRVGATLIWRLIVDETVLDSGSLDRLDLAAGSVRVVGRSRVVLPDLPCPVKAKLTAELAAAGSANSWDIWILPKAAPRPDRGAGIAVSPALFDLLAPRYPGLKKLGTPGSKATELVVALDLKDEGVQEALERGRRVLCLSLPGFDLVFPGVKLGVWFPSAVSNQAGTVIAQHPAFGDFPNAGTLDPAWFRLVYTAERLEPGHHLQAVEPLMVGIGKASSYLHPDTARGYPLGVNLYAFQTRAARGALLATGLDLVSDHPEAAHLLDQFIQYVRGPHFQPRGRFDLDDYRASQACRRCDRRSWRVVRVSLDSPYTNNGYAGVSMLLDDNPETYWHTYHDDKSRSAPPHEVVLDMGRSVTLEAFTLLPHLTPVCAPDEYEFQLSDDGERWTPVVKGEFTDIKTQRGLRVIPLPQPRSGRFLRFVARHAVDNADYVIVAGIGAIEAPRQPI